MANYVSTAQFAVIKSKYYVTRYEKTDHFEDLLILQDGRPKSAQIYFGDFVFLL